MSKDLSIIWHFESSRECFTYFEMPRMVREHLHVPMYIYYMLTILTYIYKVAYTFETDCALFTSGSSEFNYIKSSEYMDSNDWRQTSKWL